MFLPGFKYVVKRDGRSEPFQSHKIRNRFRKLSNGLFDRVKDCDDDVSMIIAQKVIDEVYYYYKGSSIKTSEIDELAAKTAADMSIDHPDFGLLASRIVVLNLHKNTIDSFSKTINMLYNHFDELTGRSDPLVAADVYEIVMKNALLLDTEIDYDRDFQYDYFGFKTLETSCLLKIAGEVVERPQHMLMRVAVGIHKDDISSAIRTYHMMSQHWFTYPCTTLYSAGTPTSHLSMEEEGSSINRTPACGALHLEPWDYDILEFIDLSKSHRKEELRACGQVYALWVPDLFMRRMNEGGEWSLFCPDDAPGLADCCCWEFEYLYEQYEREGKAKKVVPARFLWFEILLTRLETGNPSVFFKDTFYRKSSDPQNPETIKSLNLCKETIECTNLSETASIALPRFVREKGVPIESQPSKLVGSGGSKDRYFDFAKLAEVTSFVTTNLNKVVDINYSAVDVAKSNLEHRRIGIGIQGLADTFILLGIPFDSPEAKQLNKDIFETIYYHALKASSELAAIDGPYEAYWGSFVSKGVLQPDFWGVVPSDRWDWAVLRDMISSNGVRNSLLVAPIPSASTSQILCNNESFEQYISTIYNRRVSSGEFVVVNKHLLHDLTEMGLWSRALKNKIISSDGSVLKISEIPDDLKAIYKTAWEIKGSTLIDLAADRGCYIDQSQILNIDVYQSGFLRLTTLNYYAWTEGLLTAPNLRSRVAPKAIKRRYNFVDGDWCTYTSAKKARMVCI